MGTPPEWHREHYHAQKNDNLMIMRMSMAGVSIVVIAVIAIITVTEAI